MSSANRRQKQLQDVVTVQGLTQISDTDSSFVRRRVWFLIFCGGLAFTTFNIYKQIMLYLSTPVNVRVDHILGNTLPFPSITLCNTNYIKKSFLDANGLGSLLGVLYPYSDFDENITQVNIPQASLSASSLMQDPRGTFNIATHSAESTILKMATEHDIKMAEAKKIDFSDSVTIQGLNQVFDQRFGRTRRVVWFVILLGGLAFTSYNIYTQVKLFMSTPVNVRIDIKLGKTVPLPSITICNNNGLKRSKAVETSTLEMTKLVLPYFRNTTEISKSKLELANGTLRFHWQTLAMTLMHQPYEMLLECDWESRPCGLDQFTEKFTDMGLCFSFNLNGSKFARNSGRAHGLRLVLTVQEEEYVRSLAGYLGTAFMIAVHAPEVPPIMSEMGIAIAPGFQHFMGVGVKVQTAKDGISGCGVRKLEHTQGNYSREACRLECRGNYVTEICNCRDFSMPNNVSICSPPEYHSCFLPTLDKYLQEGTGCEAECPEPCRYTSFSPLHSSSPLTRDYITEYTKAKGQTEAYWRKNLVILEVYLASMAYEHMEKQLGYEILDLFCDIGGAMGLLLGASILTVLEVLDYMCLRSLSKMFGTNRVQKIDIKPGK